MKARTCIYGAMMSSSFSVKEGKERNKEKKQSICFVL